jgi:tripartite-type tricarboxylate transporter receptor subunit TctC
MRKMMNKIVTAAFFVFAASAQSSYAQLPFYQDKTITVILGGPPSGSADLRTRGVINTLRKHIPGNPVIVMQYMGGGGGRQAANHVYNVAKPDGLIIGSMGAALVTNAVLGATGVQYDIDKLTYLGTPDSAQHYLFVTYRHAGLDTLEKLRAASAVRIAAQSVGHPVYITGRMFAYILGLKDPRFVVGFTGPEIDIAIEQREADARSNTSDSMVRRNRVWLEKKLIDIHAGIEIPKGERDPRFDKVPDLETFAKSEAERKIMQMFRSFRQAGQSFFLPPGVPEDRVKILREAMRKTLSDSEFLKDYQKVSGEEPTPLMPEALEKVVRELPRDAEAVGLFNKLAGGDPLPRR